MHRAGREKGMATKIYTEKREKRNKGHKIADQRERDCTKAVDMETEKIIKRR